MTLYNGWNFDATEHLLYAGVVEWSGYVDLCELVRRDGARSVRPRRHVMRLVWVSSPFGGDGRAALSA